MHSTKLPVTLIVHDCAFNSWFPDLKAYLGLSSHKYSMFDLEATPYLPLHSLFKDNCSLWLNILFSARISKSFFSPVYNFADIIIRKTRTKIKTRTFFAAVERSGSHWEITKGESSSWRLPPEPY